MNNLKNRKIEFARFHAGVSVGPKVLNSAVPGKDNVVSVELLDFGLHILSKDAKREYEDLIPFSDILSIRLAPMSEESKKEALPVKKAS